MKILGINKLGWNIELLEIETTFLRGRPIIQIVGLPDVHVKEGLLRMRSALEHQGYAWSSTKQVLINLLPQKLKKLGLGLELSMCLSYLIKSGQINEPPKTADKNFLVVGELGLEGDIKTPSILESLTPEQFSGTLITGFGVELKVPACRFKNIGELKDPEKWILEEPQKKRTSLSFLKATPPQDDKDWPTSMKRQMNLLALGKHSALLAGPAGHGKSTFLKSLWSQLPQPQAEDYNDWLRLEYDIPEMKHLNWAPLVAPHHSITATGLTGGGPQCQPGEISRAHKGLLVLDELLEFQPKVLESLREPIEEKKIRLTRGAQSKTWPCDFQCLATTNLCPCGKWMPGQNVYCGRSLGRCKSYLNRLSGPLLDRFEILIFFNQKIFHNFEENNPLKPTEVKTQESLKEAINFKEQRLKEDMRTICETENKSTHIAAKDLKFYMTGISSARRLKAFKNISRSLADLDLSDTIKPKHMDEAYTYSIENFEQLQKMS